MYRLRRILTLVLLPLFLAGCGSGGEDSEVELQVEVNCSASVLTRTEPLPRGTHPEGWITTGNNYWDCDGSKEYYHADGTFRGICVVEYTHIEQGFSDGRKNFLPQDFHKNP